MEILQILHHSLLAYILLSTDVTCCCKTADATLGCSGIIEVMISPVMTCCNWFSWIARAGTLIVKTRFSVSFGCGGRVIWIGMSLFGSRVVCWSAGGPFCVVELDAAAVGVDCDVAAWPGSVLIAGWCCCCWGAFEACTAVFDIAVVAVKGGILAFPFTEAPVFFCSDVVAFLDFVPFVCWLGWGEIR